MGKVVIFLGDGMADEPLPELNYQTPLEFAHTPGMDEIARQGASGTFLTLPEGVPTSSDVANMSVLGFSPLQYQCGRGPLEALSQGIELEENDVAFRCNLITLSPDGVIEDYSAGHLSTDIAQAIITFLNQKFNHLPCKFYPGVSYRHILVLKGKGFSPAVDCAKPDSSHGLNRVDLFPRSLHPDANETAQFLKDLMLQADEILREYIQDHPEAKLANAIWPWSPGKKPNLPSFEERFHHRGAIIAAVDVIFGLGIAVGMDPIHVPGATGFIDTNYEGKADAAIRALEDHDLVYLHLEAIDECGHLGDLKLKIQAIEDFDRRIIRRVMDALRHEKDITYAVLPDHPVPVKLRKHTRTPVPFAVCGPHIPPDDVNVYHERAAQQGSLGLLKGSELMELICGLRSINS